MEKRTSFTARIVAVIALVAAVVAVFVVASGGFDDESSKRDDNDKQHHAKSQEPRPRTQAKTYEVKPGDTLTAISHKTGVPVEEIIDLNPEVDPQILIAGETLKLR